MACVFITEAAMPRNRNVWVEGFKAGQVFGSRCPYPAGTQDARQWELGWSEGVLQRTDAERSDRVEPPPLGWLQLFRRFVGQ